MVQPSYSREPSKDETTNTSDYKSGLYDPQISTNGYVCLHNIASKIKGYTPMVRLASKPKPRVIPDHGSYVDMNRLSQSY